MFAAIGLDVISAESLFGFEPQHEQPDLSTSAITEEKVNLPDSSILQPAIQVCIKNITLVHVFKLNLCLLSRF